MRFSRNQIIVTMLVVTAAACGAQVVWRTPDPRPAIRAEWEQVVADAGNHAPYADLVRAERAMKGKLATVTAVVPCFWSGEGRFGLVDGVYRTTPGYVDGREVVRIEFDASTTSAEALLKLADPSEALPGESCRINLEAMNASHADTSLHPDDQPKFYLQQTELRFIPMTAAQQTRINAYVHDRKPYEPLLSPKQLELLARVKANPDGKWTNYVDDAGM